jgi:hypothetical protein
VSDALEGITHDLSADITLRIVSEVLQLASATSIGRVVSARGLDAITRRLEHLQQPSSRVPRVRHVRDLRDISGCRARHEARETIDTTDAIAACGNRLDAHRRHGLFLGRCTIPSRA